LFFENLAPNEMKLCTVIITTFNRENLIVATLDSVYNQTYRPIELIIVEDGSSDCTSSVIKGWINGKSDLDFAIIFQTQENKGAPSARNLALSLCSGEYIQEVGSDDLLHSKKLELQIAALEENKWAQCAWNPLLRFNHGDSVDLTYLRTNIYRIANNSSNVFDSRFQFLPSAGLHRAEVFRNTGSWDVSLKRWQDLIYHVRMSSNIHRVLVFDTPMYFFRQHSFGRINDQYRNKDGITNGLFALGLLETYLTGFQKRNKGTRKEIFYLYLSLFQTAIDYDLYDMLKVISLKLFYWSPGLRLTLKSLLLMIIVRAKFQKYFIRMIRPINESIL
jgi:glycosyltransferase involved in cell wall biosynthesis